MTTIDQQAALLRAVCQRPDDMHARLVFADWCEDNGQEARAEFIRVQIELSAWGAVEGAVLPYDAPRPFRRERELLKMCGEAWLHHFPGDLVSTNGAGNELAKGRGDKRIVYTFRNGFVESVTTTSTAWLARGKQIVVATPVRTVRLSDKRPGSMYGTPGRRWWSALGNDGAYATDVLPECLFDLLSGFSKGYAFADEQAALDALSAAAVTWARQQAGLDTKGVAT